MRHSSFVEIDLDLLAQNVEDIKKLAGKSKLIPMVKANAYGNGLVPVSQFLVGECGIEKLGVATLGEALCLMEEIPGLSSEVMVFSDTEMENAELRRSYAHYHVTPVLHRMSDLNFFFNDDAFKRTPVVIKINTGMNRLGFSMEELEKALPFLKRRGIDHLMTHFACSYYPFKAGDKTARQLEEFAKALRYLKASGVEVRETSVANSGAIEQKLGTDQSYVRPGVMMYGPYSVEPRLWSGKQISRFVTKVLKTFSVKKGTPVGYGVHVVGEDSFVAIVAVGYGDGLMTFASGVEIRVNGELGKIFARVNMDMAFILFAPEVAGKIKEGDSIEIWNHDASVITEMGHQMKTHAYQLMCGISSRVPRIYKVK